MHHESLMHMLTTFTFYSSRCVCIWSNRCQLAYCWDVHRHTVFDLILIIHSISELGVNWKQSSSKSFSSLCQKHTSWPWPALSPTLWGVWAPWPWSGRAGSGTRGLWPPEAFCSLWWPTWERERERNNVISQISRITPTVSCLSCCKSRFWDKTRLEKWKPLTTETT